MLGVPKMKKVRLTTDVQVHDREVHPALWMRKGQEFFVVKPTTLGGISAYEVNEGAGRPTLVFYASEVEEVVEVDPVRERVQNSKYSRYRSKAVGYNVMLCEQHGERVIRQRGLVVQIGWKWLHVMRFYNTGEAGGVEQYDVRTGQARYGADTRWVENGRPREFVRALVRFEKVKEDRCILYVPGWNPHRALLTRLTGFPDWLREIAAPDLRVFAFVNIGAETASDLVITEWEKPLSLGRPTKE